MAHGRTYTQLALGNLFSGHLGGGGHQCHKCGKEKGCGAQVVLSTAGVPVEHYFLPAALGLGLLCLDEGRKACVRRWPNSLLAKMAW